MLISEETLDQALTRAFTGRVLLGDFDPIEQSPYSKIPVDCLESQEHRALARETARQSIVLFKNQNKTLPLDKNKVKKIAVIVPWVMFATWRVQWPTGIENLSLTGHPPISWSRG